MIGTVSVVAGVACMLVAIALALSRDPRRATSSPAQLRFSVVDIGDFRYFDVRAFPRQALLGYAHVDAAKRAISAGDASPRAYVWVMPRDFASLLEECEGFAKQLLLARLRDPVPRPTPVFVYVDGWQPDTTHDVIAREANVELLLELPRIVGPSADVDVRGMLDEARERR